MIKMISRVVIERSKRKAIKFIIIIGDIFIIALFPFLAQLGSKMAQQH